MQQNMECIEKLRSILTELYQRYGSFTHPCVVMMSQVLDKKLNELHQGKLIAM